MKYLFLVLLLLGNASFAQTGARGGDDGLDYRLNLAKTLAGFALQIFSEKMPIDTPSDIRKFYNESGIFLRNEISQSRFLIRPKTEVSAMVGGVQVLKKAVTGFTPLADVLISRELNEETSLAEMTAILIHEVGHHTGLHDENESSDELSQSLFLNRFAALVLNSAASSDVLFRAKVFGTVTVAELAADDSLAAIGMKHFVSGFYYAYHLNFQTREMVLSKLTEEENNLPPREPAFAKKFREDHPNSFVRFTEPEDPVHNPYVYAKTILTPAERDSFFEINRKPITIELESLSDKGVFYRVTFSHWADQLYPIASQISITPIRDGQAVWSETIEMLPKVRAYDFNTASVKKP